MIDHQMTNFEVMKSYLIKMVFAPLREEGFIGKYPHFRRICKDHVELITVQTNKYGGSFTVEVSFVTPDSSDTNYSSPAPFDVNKVNVWDTNLRYRLKGMHGGWFYYNDLYVKSTLFFGKDYLDVSKDEAADFVAPKGYKLVQKFDEDTAFKICNEVKLQLVDAFKWLRVYVKNS